MDYCNRCSQPWDGHGTACVPQVWANATGGNLVTSTSIELVGVPFCPDLLRYDNIGAADNMRGRIVRGFFWLMRCWK